MNGIFTLIVYCLLLYNGMAIQGVLGVDREPQCYSRYDFDSKVVEDIASLKASEKSLSEKVATLKETVNTLQETIRGE